MRMPERFWWWRGVLVACAVVGVGCGNPGIFKCDPEHCPVQAACLQQINHPENHICFNFEEVDPLTGCRLYNGVATGFLGRGQFDFSGAWPACKFPDYEDSDDCAEVEGTECIILLDTAQPVEHHFVRARDLEPCSNPVGACGLSACSMSMIGGCFGSDEGIVSISNVSGSGCIDTGSGIECVVSGMGRGIICTEDPMHPEWTFQGAVINEDCTGAVLGTPPCPSAGAVSFRVAGTDLVLRRAGQPDVMLRRNGGGCPPTPGQTTTTSTTTRTTTTTTSSRPRPTTLTTTTTTTSRPPSTTTSTTSTTTSTSCASALQGCWVGGTNAYVRIGAPAPDGSVSGQLRGLFCTGTWTFQAAPVDSDCMGALIRSCPGNDAQFRLVTQDTATIRRQGATRMFDLTRGQDSQCQ